MIDKESNPHEFPQAPYVLTHNGVCRADKHLWYQKREHRATMFRPPYEDKPYTLPQEEVIHHIFPQTDTKFGAKIVQTILDGIRLYTPKGKETILADRGGAVMQVAFRHDALNGPDVLRTLSKLESNPLLTQPNNQTDIPSLENRARRVLARLGVSNLDVFAPMQPSDLHKTQEATASLLEKLLEHIGLPVRRIQNTDGSIQLTTPFCSDIFHVHHHVIGWPKTGKYWGDKSVFSFGPSSPPNRLQFELGCITPQGNPDLTIFRTRVSATDANGVQLDAFDILAKPEPTTPQLALINNRAGALVDSGQNIAQLWRPDGTVMIPSRKHILDTEPRVPSDAWVFNNMHQLSQKWSRLFRRHTLASPFAADVFSNAQRFPESMPGTIQDMESIAMRMDQLDIQGQHLNEETRMANAADITIAFHHNHTGAPLAAWWGAGVSRGHMFPNAPWKWMRIGMPRGTFVQSGTAVVFDPTNGKLEWSTGIDDHLRFAQWDTDQAKREWNHNWGAVPQWNLPRGSRLAQFLWLTDMYPKK